mgnify:CR=1 FL=1
MGFLPALKNSFASDSDKQYFLGHSPTSMADRSYAKKYQAKFDRLVRWVGQQLGFEK